MYVAIPARDLLYVAPKSNTEALKVLAGAINHHFSDDKFAQSSAALVRHIYERSNGDMKWARVATIE